MAAQLDVARLKAALAPGDDPVAAFVPPADAPPAQVATARAAPRSIRTPSSAPSSSRSIASARQKEAERDSAAATVAKLQATIPILQQRVDIRKYLADKEYGSKLTYLETLTDLVQQQKDLPVEQSHLREAEAALTGIATRARRPTRNIAAPASPSSPRPSRRPAGWPRTLIKATGAHPSAGLDRAGRRRGAAARRPYRRRRRDAGAAAARGRAARQPARNRGRWCPTAMSASSMPARRRRSRSIHSTSPSTGCCTAAC